MRGITLVLSDKWRDRSSNIWFALIATFGLALSLFWNFPLRTSQDTASDMKTLYASAWCFSHGLDAYSINNVQLVFHANQIVFPHSWFGHAPVYPPSTLALITPFTFLSMSTALYCMTAVSLLLLAVAMGSLLSYAGQRFQLPFVWKAVLVSLCVSSPMISFALGVGNLSVASSALAIIAFTRRGLSGDWINAFALAFAVILKPHLGIWFLVGLVLLPGIATRTLAVRATTVSAAFISLTAVAMAARGTFLLQMHSFLAMLRSETSLGSSMNASSHEALPSVSQVTSLQSVIGFWSKDTGLIEALAGLSLIAVGVLILRKTLCARDEETVVVAMGAWVTLGLLSTYHRTHDAIGLIFLLPYIMAKIRREPTSWQPWAIAAMYAVMSFGPDVSVLQDALATGGEHPLLAFFLFRQAAFADIFLLLILLSQLYESKKDLAPYGSRYALTTRLGVLVPVRTIPATRRAGNVLKPTLAPRVFHPRKEGTS